MWQGGSLWLLEAPGGLGEMDEHAHHAIQISLLLRGRQRLIAGTEAVETRIAAVDADRPHVLELEGLGALLFVDPESAAGRALRAQLFAGGSVAALDETELADALDRLTEGWDAGAPREWFVEAGRRLVDRIAPPGPAPLPDPRVRAILDELERRLDAQPTLGDCAPGIYLSESRLRHLFAEQTGMPFKSYLLWRRLIRAVDIYSGHGGSLTEAAHEAGFSDSAHFSRTFRRTFGLPATSLART